MTASSDCTYITVHTEKSCTDWPKACMLLSAPQSSVHQRTGAVLTTQLRVPACTACSPSPHCSTLTLWLFLIFARIYFASSFDPESSMRGLPGYCLPLAARRAALFHLTAISAPAGNGRSTQPRTRACCSSKSRAEQAAQGTATCPEHMVVQAAAIQSLT
ncbi:hypothetical protein Anapl_09614 [Anas platyrhynchos]|uniref:Uncharacterized protein n=1 Tax=Anas platyrhynchos TaxID=8839 RepID=R0LE36_ANAPL|nr:hypothetical protein Anapl_09614 [Anas platyrhynchos]